MVLSFILSWLKRRRRRKLLAEPFPEEWRRTLRLNLPLYPFLTPPERSRLRDAIVIFVHEKNWEGCGGLEITSEIKAAIAAQACLLVLGTEKVSFDHVQTILVYPTEFFVEDRRVGPDGTMCDDLQGHLGEAWHRGPVVLSWADVRQRDRFLRHGINVVFHEFAHQLDMLDGETNGTPPLDNRRLYRKWQEVMTEEFEKLEERSRLGQATLLDKYGAQNPAEFFAVCTECFFEKPLAFARRHGKLYDLLKGFYRQDPAERIRRARKDERLLP